MCINDEELNVEAQWICNALEQDAEISASEVAFFEELLKRCAAKGEVSRG